MLVEFQVDTCLIALQISYPNDLTSLALTHSALHRLVTPYIYPRSDIVWPDSLAADEPGTGVDALTHGLATLVMNEDILGVSQLKTEKVARGYCENCTCNGCELVKGSQERALSAIQEPRRGNHYSRHIRKFSIGNGPSERVQEYLITKEGGKMLGTLVALAVAHMHNLDAFIWDMPTGILRDVWISLSSQDQREKGIKSKLGKVWVRFHDNREVAPERDPAQLTAGV